jgi:hypothetical protein
MNDANRRNRDRTARIKMNAPVHMLVGMAVFGRRGARMRTSVAALGAVLPDLPAIGTVLWARWIDGRTPTEIYRNLYFSDPWQAFFAPWHSFFVWTGVLMVGLIGRWTLIQVLAAAALLHLVCDFPIHADDAHRHLWPLSDWRFRSPISYWNPAHHGDIVQPVELALAFGLIIFLFLRHRSRPMLVVLATLVLAYAAQLASFAMIS